MESVIITPFLPREMGSMSEEITRLNSPLSVTIIISPSPFICVAKSTLSSPSTSMPFTPAAMRP